MPPLLIIPSPQHRSGHCNVGADGIYPRENLGLAWALVVEERMLESVGLEDVTVQIELRTC